MELYGVLERLYHVWYAVVNKMGRENELKKRGK